MRYANDQLVTAMQWCAKHHDFSKSRETKQLLDPRETMLEVIDELHQDAKISAIETKEALSKAQRQLAANPNFYLSKPLSVVYSESFMSDEQRLLCILG